MLAHNWRGGGGEIDIVARRGRVLAFVEVKTRARADDPDQVTSRQRTRIARAAAAYLATHPDSEHVDHRLDLALVTPRSHGRPWRVELIADAWTP